MAQLFAIALVVTMIILIGSAVYSEIQVPEPSAPSQTASKPSAPAPRPSNPSTSFPSSPRPSTPSAPSSPSQPEIVTASAEDYERFERIMPQTDLVQDIPEAGKIQMSFFNFNTGEREWERDYILTTGSVVQGIADDVDIKLILHSRNLPKLNEHNVCEVFQQAKTQGDFGSELLISKITFTWRYKGMMGYKSCLGF